EEGQRGFGSRPVSILRFPVVAEFLLRVNNLDVRHLNFLQAGHDTARTADEFHEHIAGAAIALANGVAEKFRDGQLGTVRIFIAHRAIHSLSHEIARLDSHQLIELQLSAINALQYCHRDRHLVNAMHREMLVAVEVRRFARLEELDGAADAPVRGGSNLFELTWQASERERGGESGSDKEMSHPRWTLAGNCVFNNGQSLLSIVRPR